MGLAPLIAKEALERGDNVVATARTPAAAVKVLGERPNLLIANLDVTDGEQSVEAAQAAVDRFGRIDVLINNAGFGLLGAVEEATAAEIQSVYGTNVFGLLAVTKAVFCRTCSRQRTGRIFNMSSIGGYAASAGWGVYGSTKFAVEGITEALALELRPLGIFATVVEPGFFRTDFLDASSLSVSQSHIEDYKDTAGAMRSFASSANHALARRSRQVGEGYDDPCRPRGAASSDALRQRYHPTYRIQECVCRT